MPKKNISSIERKVNLILGKFAPAVFPTIKGTYPLMDFVRKSLPAYVTDYPHGVEIVIRKGLPYVTAPVVAIRNIKFREKFKLLFNEVGARMLTTHAVVTTRMISTMKLIENLMNPEGPIPNDIGIKLNLSTYESATQPVKGKKCIEISEAVFGTDTPYIPKVSPSQFTEVGGISKMEEVAEFIFSMYSNNRGLLVVSKDGFYKQGRPSLLDANIAIFSPTKTVTATIEYVNDSYKDFAGNEVMINGDDLAGEVGKGKIKATADSLILKVGKDMLEYDINNLPLSLRSHFSMIVDTLVGRKAVVEILEMPGQKKPIINRLIKVKI